MRSTDAALRLNRPDVLLGGFLLKLPVAGPPCRRMYRNLTYLAFDKGIHPGSMSDLTRLLGQWAILIALAAAPGNL